jgi:hypothetical protein
VLVSIENVTGTSFDDFLTGDNSANVLSGGGGLDVINGGHGDDVIDGGDGQDVIDGGGTATPSAISDRARASASTSCSTQAAGATPWSPSRRRRLELPRLPVRRQPGQPAAGLRRRRQAPGLHRQRRTGRRQRPDVLLGGAGEDTLDGGAGRTC